MEAVTRIASPSMAMISALTLTAAAYMDARFGISTDLSVLRQERAWTRRLGRRIAQLRDVTTLYGMLEHVVDVELKGASEALWFEHKTWTYCQLKDLADRFATQLHIKGVGVGDFVAVYMTNSPEMVITLYALSKLGAVAAMINTNLRDDTFNHCLQVAGANLVISTLDLSELVGSRHPHLALDISSFDEVSCGSVERVSQAQLQRLSPSEVPTTKRTLTDLTALIFTSGTTGKPKACAIRNLMNLVTSNPLTIDVENSGRYYPLRTYSSLPLFHGTAYFTGICYSVGNVGCLCLRRKFSASQFWKDVHDSKATRILYIGELCRYLIATPKSPYDQNHSCIVAAGNGLRGDIWEAFKERFNVPEIREFYRSTEGIAKFDNFGKGVWGAGKVGFSGLIRRFVEEDVFIVKYDPDTESPYRDPRTGLCVRANPGEEGEAIGRVRNRSQVTEYLRNADATEQKLIRDVFKKGDLFQRSGDLLVQDSDGWVKFQDRVGDTFRWKGENVSAGEVRDHICRIPLVHDAIVYGIKLDGYDGQAGAAGITLKKRSIALEADFMKRLYRDLRRKGVPPYALPRLVRIIDSVETGVTFKQAKGDLVKRGWDPSVAGDGDHLYWLDKHEYRQLDKQSWLDICTGKAKL